MKDARLTSIAREKKKYAPRLQGWRFMLLFTFRLRTKSASSRSEKPGVGKSRVRGKACASQHALQSYEGGGRLLLILLKKKLFIT